MVLLAPEYVLFILLPIKIHFTFKVILAKPLSALLPVLNEPIPSLSHISREDSYPSSTLSKFSISSSLSKKKKIKLTQLNWIYHLSHSAASVAYIHLISWTGQRTTVSYIMTRVRAWDWTGWAKRFFLQSAHGPAIHSVTSDSMS